MRRRLIAALACLPLLLGGAIACGGGDDPATTGAGAASTATGGAAAEYLALASGLNAEVARLNASISSHESAADVAGLESDLTALGALAATARTRLAAIEMPPVARAAAAALVAELQRLETLTAGARGIGLDGLLALKPELAQSLASLGAASTELRARLGLPPA